MAAPAEDPAEAAADRTDVPDSLGGRRSFAPARPGVNVARGEDALRAYLAWDGHARAAHMDPDAFARWLEREVLQYMTANRASLLRARADGVRRLHAPTLDPLAHALERAEAEYRGSAEGARIERATHAVAQRRAAVAGIRSFLESTPTTPELAAKQAAASDKLEHALASLPAAELELKDAVASSPLWRDVEHERDALRAERERTGLASADDDARRASNLNGNSLVTKGDDYEKTCADVVADAFLASGGLIGGADGVPTDGVPTEGDGVLLLRNVTLGLHSGELDCVLVRVNHSGGSRRARSRMRSRRTGTGRRGGARWRVAGERRRRSRRTTSSRRRGRTRTRRRLPVRRLRCSRFSSLSETPTTWRGGSTRGRRRSRGSRGTRPGTTRASGRTGGTPAGTSAAGTTPCDSPGG